MYTYIVQMIARENYRIVTVTACVFDVIWSEHLNIKHQIVKQYHTNLNNQGQSRNEKGY